MLIIQWRNLTEVAPCVKPRVNCFTVKFPVDREMKRGQW